MASLVDLALLATVGVVLVLLLVAWIRAGVTQTVTRTLGARRADVLKRELLTPDEIDQLQHRQYLDVASRSTPNRVYRIPAQPGRVTVLDGGCPSLQLCSYPTGCLPAAEHVLAHKLMLEGDEAEYWRHANRLPARLWLPASDDCVEMWTIDQPGGLPT